METPFVNIHTHRPTGHGIEPASVGIHPWEAAEGDLATVREHVGPAQIVGEIGLDYLRPDRVLADLVHIFHPELSETDELYYYRQLE